MVRNANDVEITCITKATGAHPKQSIISVGGIRPDGKPWKLSEKEVLQSIERGRSFHIMVGRQHVPVIVATKHGHKYIKTVLDRDVPTLLLRLPECP
jgi:hypothetical protein